MRKEGLKRKRNEYRVRYMHRIGIIFQEGIGANRMFKTCYRKQREKLYVIWEDVCIKKC